MKRIATVGNFDGVHRGHRAVLHTLLREASRRGEEPLVITFRNHPLQVVAPERAPLSLSTPEDKEQRLQRIAGHCEMLEFTPELCRLTAREWMARLRDDYDVRTLVLGYDNTFGTDGRTLSPQDYIELGRETGIEIVIVPAVKDYSSTNVRRAVADGDMQQAAQILGRYYALPGHVRHGDRIGTSIGIPTANLDPISGLIIPPTGVYAGYLRVPAGEYRQAVINVGHRPSLDDKYTHSLRIEAHVPGWTGDMYEAETAILFVARIRDEQAFESLEVLRKQIDNDIETMRRVLAERPVMSVIIPVYNGAKYLAETIRSLMCQSAPDWEALLIDDSSTDDSYDVIQRAAESDSRIRAFRKPNEGYACFGISYGVERARGEFFQYMSQDDMLSADLLECAVEMIDTAGDIDAVLPQMRSWHRETQSPSQGEIYPGPEVGVLISGREAFELSLNWQIHGFAMVRMSLVRRLGISTDSLASDEYDTRRQYLACRHVAVSSGVFYYHTGNPDAISRKWRPELIHIAECDVRLLELAAEAGVDTPAVRVEIGRRLADDLLRVYDTARHARADRHDRWRIGQLMARTSPIWNIKGVSRRMRVRLLMISKKITILHPKCK